MPLPATLLEQLARQGLAPDIAPDRQQWQNWLAWQAENGTAASDTRLPRLEDEILHLLLTPEAPLGAMPRVMACLGHFLSASCGALWLQADTDGPLSRQLLWHASKANLTSAQLAEVGHCPLRDAAQPDAVTMQAHQTGQLCWEAVPAIAQARPGGRQQRHFPLLPHRAADDCAQLITCALPLVRNGSSMGVLTLLTRRNQAGDAALTQRLNGIGHCIAQILHLEQARLRLQAQADHQASHDPLTALPNRQQFMASVGRSIAQARRHGHRLAILFLDIDQFKQINSSMGHQFGDALLLVVAERLRQSLRKGDLVSRTTPAEGFLARYGCDEFVVLLDLIDNPEQAVCVAQKLLEALSLPCAVGAHCFQLTASIGISTFPDHGRDASALMHLACLAMKRAKARGGGWQQYVDTVTPDLANPADLETALRQAIRRDELRLLFQPKLSLHEQRLAGVEALVRWQHPLHGCLLPDHFIALAESSGLIVPLTAWVLSTACQQHRAWIAEGLPPLPIAVNLSARLFLDADIALDIADLVRRCSMDPRFLELEVTESMMMQDVARAQSTLRELRQMGAKIAIDDFGTGYSSLSHLKHFEVDVLKIDRIFIKDLPGTAAEQAMARAIIALGHGLGLEIVAEGVETAAQQEFVSQHGCDLIQGFHYAEPLTASELVDFYRSHSQR